MSLNNVKRKLSLIISIVLIFVSVALSVGIMTEDVYAAAPISSSLVKFEAENRNAGTSGITSFPAATGTAVGSIKDGYHMAYYGIDLGLGITAFKAYAATNSATTIQIRTGSIYGPILGTLNVSSTGSFNTYKEMSCSVTGASGINNVYLVFSGPVNLDWCSFTLASAAFSTNAFSRIEAENYSSLYGSIKKVSFASGGYGLGYIESTDYAIYNNLNFGSGAVLFKTMVATSVAANIEIRVGGPTGTLLGDLSVPSTGSFETFKELSCSIGSIKNISNICIRFSGPVNIDWFTFIANPNATNTPIPSPTATPITRSAFSYLQAESYNATNSVDIQSVGISNGNAIGYIVPGDAILFNNIDFGTGATSLKARVATKYATSIEIRTGSITGTLMGTLIVDSTDDWNTYQEISCTVINTIKNVNNLYFVFKGPVNIDWFIFTPKDPPVIINAFLPIEAETCNSVSAENIKKMELSTGMKVVGYIQTNDFITFNRVDFGFFGAVSFKANVSNSSGSTTDIQIRLGSSTGTLLGTLSVPSTSSWDDYTQLECNISKTTGLQDLYLVFTGPVNLDRFTFSTFGAITPTPTPTSTVAATTSPSPTPFQLDEPNFYLSRDSSACVEIGSNKTISEMQHGTFNLNGLGTLKTNKEMILLVDNSKSTNYITINSINPLDYAIFSNSNLRAIGDGIKVIGDVCVNNTLETHISKFEQTGTCFAGEYKIGYGCEITGNAQILNSPVPMPGFSDKLTAEAKANSLEFDPKTFDINKANSFREKTGFDLRYESDKNLFVITGAGTFNLCSSMHFMGNLRISVPHTVNTNSCFLVADGFIALEGHDINTTDLDQTSINNTTNLLNVYSIYGKIQVSTERCKLYGILYAEGVTGNPLYPYDNGVVCLQGMSNTIYGSVVAGGNIRTEGSLSSYTHCSAISSKIQSKYMEQTTTVSVNDLAKKIIDKFAGSDIKVGALQYSDSANTNTFELYDISTSDKAAKFKADVIDKFPTTTSGHNNLGDALRRARYLLSDTTKSSPDADKYIVVLAASAPNKWTSEDDTYTSPKHTEGTADYISGDGTIDEDGKAFNYSIASAEKVKSAGIKTAFIDNSLTDITASIEQIATASGAAEVKDGRHYFTKNALSNLSFISKYVLFDPPKKAVLKNAVYEQTFPAEIVLKEGPASSVISTEQKNGITRYKLSKNLDLNLTYNGTEYKVEPYTIDVNVYPRKLGIITFPGTDSKITYTVDYIDLNGSTKTTTFVKSFNDFLLDVKLTIDIG